MYFRQAVAWYNLCLVYTQYCSTSICIASRYSRIVTVHKKNLDCATTAFIQQYARTATLPFSKCSIHAGYCGTKAFCKPPLTISTTRRTMTSSSDLDLSIDVAANYRDVKERVMNAAAMSNQGNNVRLVAVSKTKPIELLAQAYDAGCRHFGENYVQELVTKTDAWKDKADVQWHFIGALQSNKCQTLVNCCNNIDQLTVETISSIKVATKLNSAVQDKSPGQRLKVFVQVNTSGEESKSGTEPGDSCIELCRHIVQECPNLELRGIMTIGAPGDTTCFTTLVQCRTDILAAFGSIHSSDSLPSQLELSMGMSDDFEEAIAAGSTNVRVGSTIFGRRDYSSQK